MERGLPLLRDEVFDAHLLLFVGELLTLQPLDGFLGAALVVQHTPPAAPAFSHGAGALQARSSATVALCAVRRCSDTSLASLLPKSTCSSRARLLGAACCSVAYLCRARAVDDGTGCATCIIWRAQDDGDGAMTQVAHHRR